MVEKGKCIIIIAVVYALFIILSFYGCSLSENDFYYPDADTGVWAEDVSYDKEDFYMTVLI